MDASRLSPAGHAHARWLEALGHLLANTDMHLGNLSVHTHGTTLTGLAPVHDMCGGEVRSSLLDPRTAVDTVPATARDAAVEIWARVATDRRVSEPFRALAREQGALAGRVPARDG